MMTKRLIELRDWLAPHVDEPILNMALLAGDASFRRYFRLTLARHTLIAVDAPPDKENSQSFVQVGQALAQAGLHVPKMHAYDLARGFLLLSDLGDQVYLPLLTSQTADALYQQALTELLKIQRCPLPQVPHYGRDLLECEMQLGVEWFLQKHLNLVLSGNEQSLLQQVFELLIENALTQPQVSVHRDYHARNLMRLANGGVGILDFQDAVIGAITYDVVSLLRDCYIAWPTAQIEKWLLDYHQHVLELGLLSQNNFSQFWRWFEWMGLQRHLKCLGIFARKYHRDRTATYLADLPRVLQYIVDVTQRYDELTALHQFLQHRVIPVFHTHEISA